MEELRTEEEQVEALRRWWKENGTGTLIAIVVALGASFGWQAWTASQERQREQASDLYQQLVAAIESDDLSRGATLASQLTGEFSGSTYAQFAALHQAAAAVNANALDEAEKQLRWVLAKADKGSDTEHVAKLRLARVLFANGQLDQSLKVLDEGGEGPYGASYALARGDILLAAGGRDDQARSAYSQALALAGADGQGVSLPALQQKLQSLAVVSSEQAPAAAQDNGLQMDDTPVSEEVPSGEEG